MLGFIFSPGAKILFIFDVRYESIGTSQKRLISIILDFIIMQPYFYEKMNRT